MALTLKGNRTGRAGAQALAEQRAMIYEDQMKQAEKMHAEFTRALDLLKWLDPQGWSGWYDEHVPNWFGKAKPARDALVTRVKELARERELFNGQEEADVDRFLEVMEGLHVSSVAQTEVMG